MYTNENVFCRGLQPTGIKVYIYRFIKCIVKMKTVNDSSSVECGQYSIISQIRQ